MRLRSPLLLALAASALAACSSADRAATSPTSGPLAPTSGAPSAVATTVPRPASTAMSTSTPTTSTATTAATATIASTAPTTPATSSLPPGDVIGHSVGGRPITVLRRGTPGGTRVLIIGVIHGNEDAGVAIVKDLETAPLPEGVDLYLVESMNPDGQHDHRRTNAHLVDLNRNFAVGWSPLGQPGDSQYAGPSPASEPETQAIVALVRQVKPQLLIWYHQDLNRLSPSTGKGGRVRSRYAELTGLPIAPITGGTYTGTAANWAKSVLPSCVSFIVELGPTLSADQARTHADAVLKVAADFSKI